MSKQDKELDALVIKHGKICTMLNDIYVRKNHDYGDAFHKSFEEWGMSMACIRLGDKLNRLISLSKKLTDRALVVDESVEDTLMDLANYAIMTLIELDRGKTNKADFTFESPLKKDTKIRCPYCHELIFMEEPKDGQC